MMKYLPTLLLLLVGFGLFAQRPQLYKGIAFYEAKDYNNAFKKLTPVMKRMHRMPPEDQAAAMYYYNLVKINIFKRMYRMGQGDKLYNFLLEGYRGFDRVEDYDPQGHWDDEVQLYKTMYYPFVMESAENLLAEAQHAKGLSDSKRMQNYREAEEFVKLGLALKNTSAAHVLLGQIELGKDNPQQAYNEFSRALRLYGQEKSVEFSIGKAIYYRALIENASKLTGKAIQTLRWGQVFMENEHLRFMAARDEKAPIIQVKAEAAYLDILADLRELEAGYARKSPGDLTRALQAFEEEIGKNPSDYLQLIAYGAMIAEKDETKAIQLFERAIQVEQNDLLAQKKLGLLLFQQVKRSNRGQPSYMPSRNEQDRKAEVEKLEAIYPLLKKVVAYDPESSEVLEALLYIADRLDLREDYRAYRALRDKIDR